ncbi:unnamed protein product [Urochloa decumbens]|uniref:F-box domain-containing protein n=1 Tax=Urochloa decumbens TaxID=240449 RepID=A0ABC9FXC3_9POAL
MAPDLERAERTALNGGVLPADVMYEILLRVPAKALCRLRLVCRSWRSLTSDPRFAREHLPRHPLLAARRPLWGQIYAVDMSGEIVKKIRIGIKNFKLSVQADLVCLAKTKRALVLNPGTGEIHALPDASLDIAESRCILGRIPSTGEYKAIRIGLHQDNEQAYECEVITLGGGGDQKWRVKSNPPIRVFPYSWSAAAVNGVAYFLPALVLYYSQNITRDSIVLFDLVTEEWRQTVLEGPVSAGLDGASRLKNNPHVELAKLSGCLVMAYHNNQHRSLDLWFLVDVDRGLWNKRYSMKYSHWMQEEAPYPLVVLDDGKVVLTWVGTSRTLITYDPRTGAWAYLVKLEDCHFMGMLEGSLLCSDLQY